MPENKDSKWNWPRHLIGIVISLLCLLFLVSQVKLSDVLNTLEHFEWRYLILGIASLAVGYALRIFRWSILLNATRVSVTTRNCAAPFLGSIALNNVLPFRLGDVIRAFIFPAEMGIRKTTAVSSLFIERLFDLMTLLACLAIGLVLIPDTPLPPFLTESAIVLAIAGGLILIMVFLFSGILARLFHRLAHGRKGRIYYFYSAVSHLIQGVDSMSRPPILLSVITVSMLVWAGESGLYYFLLIGFGVDAGIGQAIIVMAVTTLSTLIPSSPGYIGPFHLAAFTVVSMLGGSSTQAASYAILSHLALWVPTTVAGAIAILMRPGLFMSVRSKVRSRI